MYDHKIVTVVLVNWNQYDYTAACIRSLLEVESDANVHIVVVDNGSTDQSAARLQETFGEQIDLLCNGVNAGFAGGNNVGIRYALAEGADYVLLLNNDTIVAPDFLTPMLRRLEADSRIGAVTGKILFAHDPTLLWAAGGQLMLWLGHGQNRGINEQDRGQYDKPEAVDFVTGCCLLTRRAVFARVGLLDERYFLYFEDADWCLRLREAGLLNWYEPGSHIWHWAGSASKRATSSGQDGRTNSFVYYYATRNNVWFLRAHAHKAVLPFAICVLFVRRMVGYTIAFTLLRRWGKLRALWRGWGDGWDRKEGGAVSAPQS